MANQAGQELASWLQSLLARSLQDQIESVQRYGDLLKRAFAGGPEDAAVRERYSSFVRDQQPRLLHELARLSLTYHEKLFQVSRDFNDALFSHVLGTHRSSSGSEGSNGEVQQLEMQLAGVAGGEVTGSIVIENHRSEGAEVSFLVSEFSGPDGGRSRPPLEIVPTRFLLAQGQQQAVTLRLGLLPELFPTPGPYRAVIEVQGHEQLEFLLTVTVLDQAEPRTAATEPAKPEPAKPEPAKPEPEKPEPEKRRPRASAPRKRKATAPPKPPTSTRRKKAGATGRAYQNR